MSASPLPQTDETEAQPAEVKKGDKGRLILILAPVVLLLAVTGLWFSGIVPYMLGMENKTAKAVEAAKLVPPSYVGIPEMTINLNGGRNRSIYLRLRAIVEVPKPEDVEKVQAALPRVQDVVQTYLRGTRPEEWLGAAGTYRLHEEFLAHANAAVAPAKLSDVLFIHMMVQ
jgi:flagellar FliL protein